MSQKPHVAAAFIAAITISAIVTSTPVLAQDVAADVVSAPAETPKLAADGTQCELHVWPTENYLGVNMGLLSGFGPVGAVADMAAHKNRVQTVKDLMRDYLGPDVQMEELNKQGITKTLKLDGYKIVMEEATPFNEDVKKDPALKAKVKAMNARIKAKKRLSDSTTTCYAELATTHIFYHKAMMYGSNLFTGWIYREFGNKPLATKVSTGQVKNPLEFFPPKTPEDIDKAKVELRDAYSKDFAEYVDKKVFGAAAKKK